MIERIRTTDQLERDRAIVAQYEATIAEAQHWADEAGAAGNAER
jgi:hypothetical protein